MREKPLQELTRRMIRRRKLEAKERAEVARAQRLARRRYCRNRPCFVCGKTADCGHREAGLLV